MDWDEWFTCFLLKTRGRERKPIYIKSLVSQNICVCVARSYNINLPPHHHQNSMLHVMALQVDYDHWVRLQSDHQIRFNGKGHTYTVAHTKSKREREGFIDGKCTWLWYLHLTFIHSSINESDFASECIKKPPCKLPFASCHSLECTLGHHWWLARPLALAKFFFLFTLTA